MFQGWTKDEIEEYQGKMRLISQVEAALLNVPSLPRVAAQLGHGRAALYRMMQAWRMVKESGNHRLLLRGKSTGRTPVCNPTAEDMRVLRDYYVRSNRSTYKGSMTMAARMAAKDGMLSSALTFAILTPRSSKHSLPKSLRDAMVVAPDLIKHHRSPTEERLGGIYCPGQLRMARDDEADMPRRLNPGERQSWDDATINFCVVVPWPWGGCKTSDRWGVKIGRFQLLAGIDDATDFCPGFSYVCRPMGSYRAEDSTAAMFRVWERSYVPKSVMLEGGVWQAHRSLNFYQQLGVQIHSAKGRPHMKLIESYWNRLWTVLSMMTDGQVGRFRGEMERETDLLMKCQAGSLNPCDVFPSLQKTLNVIQKGFDYLNTEEVGSKKYGKWIPAEAHAAWMQQHTPMNIEPGLAWTIAPEIHTRKVLSGMVKIKTESPLGYPFPYHFATNDLNEFDGKRVTVYFDTHAHPLRATIALAEEHAGMKPGTIITNSATCLDDAPEVFQMVNGWEVDFNRNGLNDAIAARKAQRRLVVTNYKAIGLDGRRHAGSLTRAPSVPSFPDHNVHLLPEAPVEIAALPDPLPKINSRIAMLAS
jgi:hypothetical protein